MGKLTDIGIRNWIAAGRAVAKSDGDGLSFTMSDSQAAAKSGTWVLRYRIPGFKSQKEIKVGSYPDMPLAHARKEAAALRVRIAQGEDVAQEKRKEKRARVMAWTVRRLAEDYLEKCGGRLAASTLTQRRQQIRDHILARIGNHLANEVTPADIVDLVEAVASRSLHVARLVLTIAREMFSHGVARHVISSSPCASVAAKAVIGPRPVHRARLMLTEAELRAVLPALSSIGRANELAIKVLLATCTRIGELTGARWDEIDFERREWTLPPERAKNRKRFVIPLAEQVVAWLAELKGMAGQSVHVLPIRTRFSAEGGDRPMEASSLNAAINRLCKGLGEGCRRFTPHDLRSTARSHLSALGVDLLVSERCLNHSLGGLVAVYDRHDFLEERRKALSLWTDFIVACETGRQWNVISFRRSAA